MSNLFKRMLPRGGEAFRLPRGGVLRALIDGLDEWVGKVREYIDGAWWSHDPFLTPFVDLMEHDLGLIQNSSLSPFDRRERIAGAIAAERTIAADGVEALIRAQGFDVYLHDTFRNIPYISSSGGLIYYGALYDSSAYDQFKFEWTGEFFVNGPVMVQGYSDNPLELAIYSGSGGECYAEFRGGIQNIMNPGTIVDDGLIHRWGVEFTNFSWTLYRDGVAVSTKPNTVVGAFTRYNTSTTFGVELNSSLGPTGGAPRVIGDLYFEVAGAPVLDVKCDQVSQSGFATQINRANIDGPTVRCYSTFFDPSSPTPPVFTTYPGAQSFAPPTPPDPANFLAASTTTEPAPGQGYPLVNAIFETTQTTIGMGDEGMAFGDDGSAMGEYSSYLERRRTYRLPADPDTWGAICYVGGESWPQLAQVPASRRDEFEALVLRHLPAHVWAGMMIEYV